MSNILIIEDDENVRSMLCDLLSDDYEVFKAKNVKEALGISKKIPPHIVLLDLNLGDSTAEEFIDKSDLPNYTVIIVLSADCDADKRSLDMFGDDFEYYVLHKPFSTDQVRDMISKATIHWAVEKLLDDQKIGSQLLMMVREINNKLGESV